MNLTTKQRRKLNEQNFKQYVLEGLQMVYKIKQRRDFSYLIIDTKFGNLIVYPKADRVLITDKNKWIDNGAEWLCNNL